MSQKAFQAQPLSNQIVMLHVKFRSFSWRFEPKSQIIEIMNFFLQKLQQEVVKITSVIRENMAAILLELHWKI